MRPRPNAGPGAGTPQIRQASAPSVSATSEVFPQIHPTVETGYLRRVAIERERRLPPPECARADETLACLAPARMIDRRVDVGQETILVGGGARPGGARCLFREFDADDGLDALEAVLPGDDQPQRRAVLIRQHLAVQSHGHQGE